MISRATAGPFLKSTHSPPSSYCVESAPLMDGGAAVRDSKYPMGPVLRFPAAGWTRFVESLVSGRLDP